jgi:hypothetical protein
MDDLQDLFDGESPIDLGQHGQDYLQRLEKYGDPLDGVAQAKLAALDGQSGANGGQLDPPDYHTPHQDDWLNPDVSKLPDVETTPPIVTRPATHEENEALKTAIVTGMSAVGGTVGVLAKNIPGALVVGGLTGGAYLADKYGTGLLDRMNLQVPAGPIEDHSLVKDQLTRRID